MPRFRSPDIHTEKFISKKTEGRAIKSFRKFGVEFEFVGEPENHNSLSEIIPDEWGVEYDGSINGARRDNNSSGVEYVSPVLAGFRGERDIRRFLEKAKEANMGVDESCSLHVHLDAPEFSFFKENEVLSKNDFDNLEPSKYKKAFIFSSSLLKSIRSKTNLDENYIVVEIVKRYKKGNGNKFEVSFSNGNNKYTFKLYSEMNHPNIRFFCLATDVKTYDTERRKLEDEYSRLVSRRLELDGEDFSKLLRLDKSITTLSKPKLPPTTTTDKVLVEYKDTSFQPLQRLLMFYTAFTDVFLAMQPQSRREGNRYCQRLDRAFSLYDIYTLRSRQELESFWYKATDAYEVDSRKNGGKYDPSRYYGLNLHRLFNKGTIELRMHAGTANEKNVLYWVALHQYIVDTLATDKISLDAIRSASDKFSIDDKIESMINLLQAPEVLAKYIRAIINFYK